MGSDEGGKQLAEAVEDLSGDKKRRGRPPGSRNKEKEKEKERIPRNRLIELMDGSPPVTSGEKQYVRTFNRLSDTEKIKQRLGMEAREKMPAENPAGSFTLQLIGIGTIAGARCPRCGGVQPPYGMSPEEFDALPADEQRRVIAEAEANRSRQELQDRREAPPPPTARAIARAQHVPFPPEPPRRRLLDPEGRPINLGEIPDPPRGPYEPGEIP